MAATIEEGGGGGGGPAPFGGVAPSESGHAVVNRGGPAVALRRRCRRHSNSRRCRFSRSSRSRCCRASSCLRNSSTSSGSSGSNSRIWSEVKAVKNCVRERLRP